MAILEAILLFDFFIRSITVLRLRAYENFGVVFVGLEGVLLALLVKVGGSMTGKKQP